MHEQPDMSGDSTTAARQTAEHHHRCCATTVADSRSDRAMQRRATHSNTATQRHSDTARSLPHTAARGNQRTTYTQTPQHTAPQLHAPLHSTLNVLVTTVVTHNGGAELHTRPQTRAPASSAATPGGTHSTCSTVLQSPPARRLQQCDTATATCTITRHMSH
jgi:hypothetical protein